MHHRFTHLAQYRNFRYGFISTPDTTSTTPIAGWRSIRIPGHIFWHHPETRVEVFAPRTGATVVLFGDAFSTTDESVQATLDRLLSDVDDARPLDTLGGRWALFLITPETARVYNDAMGGRSVYWRADGTVASHAALFEDCFGMTTDADIERFMRGTLYKGRKQTKYLPGDLTRFAGVYALIPNNYFDLHQGTTSRYWPIRPIARTSLDGLHAEIDRYLSALAAHIVGNGYRAVLGATGGADTRLVMAGLMRASVPFETFTSGWDSLKDAERTTIAKLVAAGALPHTILPDLARGDFVRTALLNSSGVGGSSATVEWFAREFHDPSAVFLIGHGGEILRDDKTPFHAFDPDLWASAYGRVNTGVEVSREDTAFVHAAFDGFFERAHVAQAEGHGVAPEELYYWEHRMAMWGGGNVANAFDAGMNTIQGYNSRRLYETAFGVQARSGSRSRRMFRDATARLAPAIDL
ncbi:hypothetical protein [Microbacterium aurum]